MGTLPSPETLRASLPPTAVTLRSPIDGLARQAFLTRFELLHRFDDVFKESPARDPLDVEDAFKLRYQVYCLDRGFESADACPDHMEHDRYDSEALHCLLRDRASAQAIGTVRLVQPAATPTWFAGLPLAEYAPAESMAHILRLPPGSTAEVSRFAITRSARTILRGPVQASGEGFDSVEDQATLGEKLLPYMSLGLIRGLVRLSMQNGITHWCLAAEPSLLRRLRGFGLHFTDAGPLVEHRGLRQICYAELSSLLERARIERPEFWDIMTVNGFLLSDDVARRAA